MQDQIDLGCQIWVEEPKIVCCPQRLPVVSKTATIDEVDVALPALGCNQNAQIGEFSSSAPTSEGADS